MPNTNTEVIEVLIDKTRSARAEETKARVARDGARDQLEDAERAHVEAETKRLNLRVTGLTFGLRNAIAIIEWMSASPDFAAGGQAAERWVKEKLKVDALRTLVDGTV